MCQNARISAPAKAQFLDSPLLGEITPLGLCDATVEFQIYEFEWVHSPHFFSSASQFITSVIGASISVA